MTMSDNDHFPGYDKPLDQDKDKEERVQANQRIRAAFEWAAKAILPTLNPRLNATLEDATEQVRQARLSEQAEKLMFPPEEQTQSSCPGCDFGRLREKRYSQPVSHKNHRNEVEYVLSECDTCGSEFADYKQVSANRKALSDWVLSVETGLSMSETIPTSNIRASKRPYPEMRDRYTKSLERERDKKVQELTREILVGLVISGERLSGLGTSSYVQTEELLKQAKRQAELIFDLTALQHKP